MQLYNKQSTFINKQFIKKQTKFKHKRNISDISNLSNVMKLIHNKQNISTKINKTVRSALIIEVQVKYARLLEMRKDIKKKYDQILEFYQTNQDKLKKIMSNQLNSTNNYLYSKEIMLFMKVPDIQPLKNLNYQLLTLQLTKFSQFLTNFNAKKKIRQVQIIKQSMLSRQSLIRQSSNNQQYQQIYKNMRIPLKSSGFTIYDQYKNIRTDFNLSQNPYNIHQRLYNKMCDAQQCITNVMKNQAQNRQRQRMSILGLIISKQQ